MSDQRYQPASQHTDWEFSRRHVSGMLASTMFSSAHSFSVLDGQALFRDVATYDSFGEHRTASAGDEACSSWLDARLAKCGFLVERQPFTVSQFSPRICRVEAHAWCINGFPGWPVGPTRKQVLRGILSSSHSGSLRKKIAVVKLPFGRGGAWTAARVAPVAEAINAGAIAVVVMTEGPTGELIALNVPSDKSAWPVPVVLIGSREEQRIESARDGPVAILTSTGELSSNAQASNVVARRSGVGNMIVVTTPKSGWFHCAGERGSGLAVFLSLADWLPRQTVRPLLFAATSGHELGGIGARVFLRESAPRPENVALWLHIGANVAVRKNVTPIVGIDHEPAPARVLYVSGCFEKSASMAIKGAAGFSKPRVIGPVPLPGELKAFHEAGYARLAGLIGQGPLFHTRLDRAATATTPSILALVASRLQKLVNALS